MVAIRNEKGPLPDQGKGPFYDHRPHPIAPLAGEQTGEGKVLSKIKT
jgi:hypothetical protein